MTPTLIQSPEVLKTKLADLGQSAYLAVDTEFIRETTFFPKIALIQLGNDKETLLIDPLVFNKEDLRPLQALLTDQKILKIMHASYADQECFYWGYGYVAAPVLDTAVAAGLLGLGDNIGLSKLLKEALDIHLPKGRSRVKWLDRPLPKELLEYAELDVRYLVRLGTALLKKLQQKKREAWALDLSQIRGDAFDEPPEKMAERLGKNAHWGDAKGYPVFIELVKWRESRARELNIPRHWLCDNDILISLAKVKPQSSNDLKTFRGLSTKEIDRSSDKILLAIRKGMQTPFESPMADSGKRARGGPHQNHVADLIQTYVYFLARELEIVPRHLLTGEQAERLVEKSSLTVDEWVRLGILSAPASILIGNDLKQILEGRKGLLIKNQKLTVFPVPD